MGSARCINPASEQRIHEITIPAFDAAQAVDVLLHQAELEQFVQVVDLRLAVFTLDRHGLRPRL